MDSGRGEFHASIGKNKRKMLNANIVQFNLSPIPDPPKGRTGASTPKCWSAVAYKFDCSNQFEGSIGIDPFWSELTLKQRSRGITLCSTPSPRRYKHYTMRKSRNPSAPSARKDVFTGVRKHAFLSHFQHRRREFIARTMLDETRRRYLLSLAFYTENTNTS